jgi:UPF0271 protein
MLLNCDLGESYGAWSMGQDTKAMAYIDQANIACGFHAGDPAVIQNTLALAKTHGVMVGAHPAYPDLVGFGRRSLNCSEAELKALLHYQIAALDGMAKAQGLQLAYVKPHGALYNDMMAKPDILASVMQAIATYPQPLHLMLQATGHWSEHQAAADQLGIKLYFEAFADRAYEDDGRLVARSKPGAVHNHKGMLGQVQQLISDGTITSINGKVLELKVDSLCVHGDNDAGIAAIHEIRALLGQSS